MSDNFKSHLLLLHVKLPIQYLCSVRRRQIKSTSRGDWKIQILLRNAMWHKYNGHGVSGGTVLNGDYSVRHIPMEASSWNERDSTLINVFWSGLSLLLLTIPDVILRIFFEWFSNRLLDVDEMKKKSGEQTWVSWSEGENKRTINLESYFFLVCQQTWELSESRTRGH